MNEYQKERMRRKEFEERKQAEALAIENSRAQKRRMAIIIASIVAVVAAILIIAPMRFKAIASNDLDEVETYLAENLDDNIIEAGLVTEEGAAEEALSDSEDQASGFMLLAESLSGAQEDPVQTTDKRILTKFLLVDSEFTHEGMQFGDLYSDEDLVANAVISQYMNELPLLDPGEDSEFYVAMLDTTQFNGYGTVIDVDFAWTNTMGQVIDDAVYDMEKGIAYVPKYLFESYDPESVDPELPVQAQLLVSYDLSAQTTDMAQVTVPLTVTSEIYDVRTTAATEFVASAFDTSVTFPVVAPEDAAKISKENLLVCLGGSDFPLALGDENSSYDSETGELTISENAMTLTSINVTIVSGDIVTSFVDAVTQPEEAEAISPDSMVTWPNGALSNLDTAAFDNAVKGKTVYTYDSKVLRFSESYDFSNLNDEDKKFQSAAAAASKYVYGGNSTAKNNEIVTDIMQGDDFGAVVNDNGVVQKSGGRGYYWQEGGGINEAFAFPGCTGVSATVSKVKRGTSYALDLSGLQSITQPGTTNYLVGAGLCSHIESSNEATQTDLNNLNNVGATLHVQNTYVIMRPLYRDAKGQYVIMAFIGARLSTQSGVGVYKFRIQQPGYAKVAKTSTEPNVTGGNGNYSLSGAKYGLYASEANAKSGQNAVGTMTTDANGNSTPISVKPGKYWAKEIAAPAGYQLNDAIIGPYDIAEGKTVTFPATDAPKKGSISVKKQDSETNKELTTGSYKMTLYAADKKTALGSVTITKAETLSFGSFGYGKYYVHEDAATYPYMTEEFGVDANTSWHEVNITDQAPSVTVTISDPQRRGEINLNKVDEAGQPVGGASFLLYANQDVTSFDGTVRHKKDQKIPVKENGIGNYSYDPSSQKYEVVTDDQGRIKVTGLYLTGNDTTTFQLVEEQPAPGFILDQTPVVFTLAKDESKKVITDTQGKVNKANGIDIYTWDEIADGTPEDPDPDDPDGGYPNTPVANKLTGVWKESDNLTMIIDEGKSGIAIRTPNGDSQYRPTLVPILEVEGDSGEDEGQASGESVESAPSLNAEAVSDQLGLRVLDGNNVDISDADAKTIEDANISFVLGGLPIGRVQPRSGAYQVVFPTVQALNSLGTAPALDGIKNLPGWSYVSKAESHKTDATSYDCTVAITHGSNTYNYKLTYMVGEATGTTDTTNGAKGADDAKGGDDATDGDAGAQALATIVPEWDAEQNAWLAKGVEPGVSYKVIIASKLVATTAKLEAGQVAYGRYSFEASENFSKGWVDQAGLPKDDSLYAYKGLTDANGHLAFERVPSGKYFISEIKPPTDETGNYTYLADRKVHTFVVDAVTGLIKDIDDVSKGYHTEQSGTDSQRQVFVIREPRTHLVLHKRSSATGEDVAGAQLVLTNEEHVVLDEWTSDGQGHAIDGLRAGTYYMSEVVTPQNYDKATTVVVKLKPVSTPQVVVMYDAPLVVGVTVDKRQEIADPLDERYMENGDGKNNAKLSVDKFGRFDYSLDARSTANSWIDELTFSDEPTAVTDGMARITGISTPQAWQDYDGKMNVWYKTNKTPEDFVDPSGANATTNDGHENVWLTMEGASGLDTDGDKRVEDFKGWKLWQGDLPTMVSTNLEVSELGLAQDEYVTGVRFEYGRVEMGFTTRPADWDRELLKDQHDDVDDILGADRLTFDAADASADAAIATLNDIVDSFSNDASKAAESVIAQRTKDEEIAYQKLIAEIAEYNDKLTPDSDLPRKFIEAPEMPAYQGDDDAVTKLNAARDAAKVSLRAIFETSNTPEGRVALSEALPGLKSLVAGAASDDAAGMVEGKINDLIAAIGAADADAMGLIEQSLIEDLDAAIDDIINAGLAGRVHYAPAVVHMQLTENYVENCSLGNAASAVAARNGGGAVDSDATAETPGSTEGEDEDTDGANTPDGPDTPSTPTPGVAESTDFEDYPLAYRDEDENFQSAKLRVIEIDTNLAFPDGSKELTIEEGSINLVDRVNFTGLTPGKEYVLVGEIHSRMGTESEGYVDAGPVRTSSGENVQSIMVFTPDREDAYVDVPFTVDVERLNAYPAVAFEELHESVSGQPGEIILAEHKNIGDADQTVNTNPIEFDPISTTSRRIFQGGSPLAQTGDAVTIGAVIIIAGLAVVGLIIWRRRNRA